MNLRERAERIVARCRQLARISDVERETTRTYLSPAMRQANERVAGWMVGAGLTLRMDAVGNLRGVVRKDAPRVVLGSHLDTVVNAGAFDGPLGVLLAIEAVEALGPMELGLEVIGFSEEEGVRFRMPFLGSRAVVGKLDEAALEIQDAHGVSISQAIRDYGLYPERMAEARLSDETFAYVEVHIEQGPVLEAEGRTVAAVSAIAGQSRVRVRFEGHANHAGTTPMGMRRDALAAAAAWVLAVEAEARGGDGLVATVGFISAEPGLGNVVPGAVTCGLDVRHAADGVRRSAVERILEAGRRAGMARGVGVTWVLLSDSAAVELDEGLRRLMEECAAGCGYDGRAVVSGAGHDAGVIAGTVPTAMLFVRTPGGVSHHPDETVRVEDVEAGLRVTMEFLGRVRPGKRVRG